MNKSTVQEIEARFDNDVERFSNLEAGQVATIDAKISLELITEASFRLVPNAINLLDVGCGAGNYTLKMLSKIPELNCTLVDLSAPMLDRAYQRVSVETTGAIHVVRGDIRSVSLENNHYDIVLAGAVLHHLRDDQDWEDVFKKIHALLKPGGCFMIADLVTQETPILDTYIWERYGDYLEGINGSAYRENVFDYIHKEDSPRSINFQIDLMRTVGFKSIEILHKNMCFGAFGGIK
ncbi:class I SAM-dependent methyltransferase [Arenibacter sp. GZD96]|uniref:class I SAM-dependent methyltransferase n=1 Tax=Aurantibrevibacter litoralis TaxID=3106030 RepID=UPI002AFF5B00|nr:class I SAM-dependent methyltransferase [Arenibacter sp. GZD-96]MEA1785248.1 class I SAM-dependent methyltransferase [Arenibacter sp. GZD-96]